MLIVFATSVMAGVALASKASSESDTSSEDPISIRFVVTGAKSQKGSVLCGLYDQEAKWLGRDYLQGARAYVDANGKARCVFRGVPPGLYAISAFHDVDDDKELDRKIFGIPSEPYCASRDARRAFGPPRWRDAVFRYEGRAPLELTAHFR
jgi:uncharacterized protein (DUF2141 family)